MVALFPFYGERQRDTKSHKYRNYVDKIWDKCRLPPLKSSVTFQENQFSQIGIKNSPLWNVSLSRFWCSFWGRDKSRRFFVQKAQSDLGKKIHTKSSLFFWFSCPLSVKETQWAGDNDSGLLSKISLLIFTPKKASKYVSKEGKIEIEQTHSGVIYENRKWPWKKWNFSGLKMRKVIGCQIAQKSMFLLYFFLPHFRALQKEEIKTEK